MPLLAALAGACSSAADQHGSGSGGLTGPGSDSGPGSGSANPGETDGGGTDGWDSGDGASTSGWAPTTSGASGGDPGGSTGTGEEPPPPDDGEDSTSDASTTGDDSTSTGEPACDEQTPVVLYLSPDDSNSTSSPVQVREAVLSEWGSLSYVPIRTWEFLNYYSFGYAAAEKGMVTVLPEIARFAEDPDEQYVVQIGVASETVSNADRPLMNVTLVLDESGSMSGAPMELQQEVCRTIAGSLRAGDIVSAVGWDTVNAVKLTKYKVTKANDPELVALCDALEPGGGTDLNGGLTAGYELAHAQFDATRINRVVLISDGGANAGVTDIDIISNGAGSQDKDGIYLVGVGVGTPDTYNDELMDTVTDVGRGASLFIPSVAEAHKMFGERFVQTMAVAVRDVRVRLDMPPGFSIVKFSGEEYSADPAEVEPQHLAPNDAMVFHQTVATCAPALVDEAAEFKVAVRWKDPITFEDRETEVTKKIQESVAAESPLLKKGAAVFAYAEGLKAYREAPEAATLAPALAALAVAEAALPGDPDLAEIRTVLETLAGG
ncbi:VWA domain-containing protein [Nannocystis sp. ILAH1]|uniref:vWA domain-containing protein n=1 Tax=Nannocystis sp. ILAH1 TaxID=2996789 RepID=UPI002270D956|nr:VWA domain-containing protein [Nannocystis sp. ILAH1]MCY0994307.1 VWA domain-containing protein [Nannocystis sp. ILAH1]